MTIEHTILLVLAILSTPFVLAIRKRSLELDAEQALAIKRNLATRAAYAQEQARVQALRETLRAAARATKPVAIAKPKRRSPAENQAMRDVRASIARAAHHKAQTARNIARIENCKSGKTQP